MAAKPNSASPLSAIRITWNKVTSICRNKTIELILISMQWNPNFWFEAEIRNIFGLNKKLMRPIIKHPKVDASKLREVDEKKTDRGCRNHCLPDRPFVVAVVGRAGHFQRCEKFVWLCPKFFKLNIFRWKAKTWRDSIWQTLFHLFAALSSEILLLHHAETFPSCWNISIMLKHFHQDVVYFQSKEAIIPDVPDLIIV